MPTWFEETWERLKEILDDLPEAALDKLTAQMVAYAAVKRVGEILEVEAKAERDAVRQLHNHLATQGYERAAYRVRRWAEEEIGDTDWMLEEEE